MADGKVVIQADFDGSKAQSGVSKLKGLFGGLSDAGTKMGSVFKSVLGANLVSSAITSGLSSVKDGIRGIVGEMNDSTKAWKTFEGNLKAFGKSSSEIATAKADMQDFATKTIYSASEMAQTYSQLEAVGTKNVGELVKAFGGLAGSAENPAQAMKSLSTQATQMAAKPKVAWQDFKIMMEQAPAGMSAVAKELGMGLDELVTAVGDGKIKTEDFFAAVRRAGGEGTEFYKMATAFQTVDQAMDGLQEGLSNGLMPVFEEFNQFGIKAITALSDVIEKIDFSKVAKDVGSFLGKINIDSIVNKAISGFSQMSQLAKTFFSSFKDTGVFQNLGATISMIGNLFSTVFKTATGDVNAFKDIAESIGDVFNLVFFVAQDVISGITSMFSSFANTGVFTAIKDAFYSLVKAGLDVSEKLSGILPWEAIGTAAGHIVKFIADIVKGIADLVQKVDGNTMRDLAKTVMYGVMAFKGFNFLKGFNPFSIFKRNATEGVDGATGAVRRSRSTISQLFSGISNVIKAVGNAIKSSLQGLGSVFTGLGKTFEGFGKGFGAATKGLMQGLKGLNPATLLSFGAAVGVAALGIGAGLALIATQSAGVSQIIQAVGDVFANLATAIIGALADALVTVAGVLPIVASSFALLSPLVTAFGDAIATVVLAIGAVAPQFGILAMAVGNAVATIIDAVVGLVTAFAPIVQIVGDVFVQVVQIVADAIVQIVQVLAPFIPAVTEMVVALAPVLSQIVEAFNNLISQISPILDSLAGLFESFGEAVKTVLDGVKGVIESIGGVIRSALEGVAGIFDSMGNAAKNAGEGVKLMAQGIKILVDLKLGDLVGTLATVATGLGAIASSGIATAGPGLQAAGIGMQMMATSAQMASIAIQLLPTALTTLSASLGTLPAMMSVAGSAMMAFATSAQTSVLGLTAIGAIITQFASMMMAIAPASAVAVAGLSAFNGQASSAGEAMSKLASASARAQSSVVALGAGIATAMSGSTAAISRAGSQMTSTMQSAMNQMTSTVRSGMTNAVSAVRNAGSQMSSALRSTGQQMVTIAQSTMNRIKSVFSNGMQNVVSAVRNGGSQMVSAFRSTGTQLVSTAQSMINQTVATVRAGYSSMQSAGNYIGQGLAVGMNSALGAVRAAANALVREAERAAQAKAKINSPSHLFRDEVGWWIGLGIAKGIDNSVPEVANSLDFIRDQVNGFNLRVSDLFQGTTASLSSQLKVETLRAKTPKVEADARQEAYVAHSASLLSDMLDKFDHLEEVIANGQKLVLDTGALVGGTAKAFDSKLGKQTKMEGRLSWQ